MVLRRRMLVFVLPAAAVLLLLSAHKPSRDDLLSQHRNLGKAFYENPTTQKQAVAEFREALALNSGSARAAELRPGAVAGQQCRPGNRRASGRAAAGSVAAAHLV